MSVVCVLHNITCVWITACLMQSICCSSFVFFFFKMSLSFNLHISYTILWIVHLTVLVGWKLWAFQYILFWFLLICFLKSKIFSERVRMIFYKFILNGLFLFKTFSFFYVNVCCQNDLMFIENFSVCILNLKITFNCILS